MKQLKRCASILLVCALLIATPVFATTKASEQITWYFIDGGSMGNGQIAVDFSIVGTGEMKQIGAQSISIYKLGASGYELEESFDKDDPGMTATNSWEYGNTIYYQGEVGEDYRIVVTLFAKDMNNDSDSRSKTLYVST